MRLLELFATINEGILDASVESVIPDAIERLVAEITQTNDSGVSQSIFNIDRYGDPYPDEYPDDHEEAYYGWLPGWVEERVHELAYTVMDGMDYDANGIVVYRVITAERDWIENIDARGLGVYWSWDKMAAKAHWDEGGSITYHITGLVDPRSVDWAHTLVHNAHPDYEHEKEIYVYEGSPIKVTEIWADDKKVDPSLYADKDMLQASVGLTEDIDINLNGQRKRATKPRRANNDVLMTVPTAVMDAAFKRDGMSFYVGPGGSDAAIGNRYQKFAQWIQDSDSYEVPEVSVSSDGVMVFTNGRHRYAVLRDAGVDPMPVAMSPESVRYAQKLLHAKLTEATKCGIYNTLKKLRPDLAKKMAAVPGNSMNDSILFLQDNGLWDDTAQDLVLQIKAARDKFHTRFGNSKVVDDKNREQYLEALKVLMCHVVGLIKASVVSEARLDEGYISPAAAAKYIASDEELWDAVAGYVYNQDYLRENPDLVPRLLDVMKRIRPFKKRLYRGEPSFEHNDYQPDSDHDSNMGFSSWSLNVATAQMHNRYTYDSMVKYTDGPIQGVMVNDIAYWRTILTGEMHNAGDQAEMLVLEPVERRPAVELEDHGDEGYLEQLKGIEELARFRRGER